MPYSLLLIERIGLPKPNCDLERLVERKAVRRIVPEVEHRIAVQALVDVVVQEVDVAADLEAVVAPPLKRREVVVVAQLEAALVELLGRAACRRCG